jgi:nitric oxide reductase subunit C
MKVVTTAMLIVFFALSHQNTLIMAATYDATSEVFSTTPQATRTPAATLTRLPSSTPQPTPTIDAARLAAGKAVYLANYCGVCHTLASAGTAGVFGPSHERIGRTAAQRIADPSYKGAARTAAEFIRESIVAPSAYFAPGAANGRHPMPSYAHLPQADLDTLVYFLLQQR